MFLVRLVRWKQPLRHVRAHNRTNSFFLSARTPWNKYFPFFLFSPPPFPPACLLFADFCHAIVISCPRTRRAEQSKHLFLRSTVELDRTPVFGIYRLFPFLISSRTSLLSPQMEIIIRPIIFAKGSVRTTVCCSFGKYTNSGRVCIFKKKNVSIFETYNTHLAVSRNFSIFVVLRKWIEPSIHSWYLYRGFCKFRPYPKNLTYSHAFVCKEIR